MLDWPITIVYIAIANKVNLKFYVPDHYFFRPIILNLYIESEEANKKKVSIWLVFAILILCKKPNQISKD